MQLFSARDFTPWDDVLDLVAKAGFDGVEGYRASYDDPAAFAAKLAARGLHMPSGHFALDHLESDFAGAMLAARVLGIKTVIAPWLAPGERPMTRAGWQALGLRLAVLDTKVRAAGHDFAWHNHDFEFIPTEDDDSFGQDILMETAPGMNWEADLGWLFRAGLNPQEWIAKYHDRIIAVHLKDVQFDTSNAPEDGWADLGRGINDWKPIFAALKTLPNLRDRVAEHDNPANLIRFVTRWKASYDQLSKASQPPP